MGTVRCIDVRVSAPWELFNPKRLEVKGQNEGRFRSSLPHLGQHMRARMDPCGCSFPQLTKPVDADFVAGDW